MPDRGTRRTLPRLAALVLLLGSACWRTKGDIQRDYARTLQPARLSPAEPATASVRTLQVRVYVGEDYQAETLRWRERIDAQLRRANEVLEAQFGIRLVAREPQTWARNGREAELAPALRDLMTLDPATDADWVIGFVSSTELFSGSQEQLGMAQIFGRHLVLRSLLSSREADAIPGALDALSDAERDDLNRNRRLHRETAVLLHEWAHTLGAFHERDDASNLMSPRYHPSASAFSPVAARIVRLGLAQRASTEPDRNEAWARAYREEVERGRPNAWDRATVEEALSDSSALAELPRGE